MLKGFRSDSPRWLIIAIGLAAVTFLSVNILANAWLGGARLDATQGLAYTISDQIKPIFEGLDEPLIVRLYYSDALGVASPRHGALYRRIRELLKQYSELSGGRVIVHLENPEPYSSTEDRAIAFGLQAVPLNNMGEVAYFGLAATNAVDEEEIIPFFNLEREQFVEYDLTRLIYNLSNPHQSTIGVISSLPVYGSAPRGQMGMGAGSSPPWAVMKQMDDFFDVREISQDVKRVPDDIDLLMMIQPTNLSPSTQFAIDQFVMRGGRLLVFLDPHPESVGPAAVAGDLKGINQLLGSWGVNFVDGKVAADLESAIRVNSSADDRPMVSDYIAWLELGPNNFDRQDAAIGDLYQIAVGTAGILEISKNPDAKITPLLTTGSQSMRIDVGNVQGMPDVVSLLRQFKSSGKKEILAVRLRGPVRSVFPDGAPDGVAKSTSDDRPLVKSTVPIQAIVIADTDILTDRFWMQESNFFGQSVAVPTADNANFIINTLENLTGSPALSSLRGRGIQNRPFILLDSIRRDAEMLYRSREKALEDRLQALEEKIRAVQLRQGDRDNVEFSEADRKMIMNHRSEILDTRQDLRDVQHALRRDIETLETVIKFINIVGVPLVFGGIIAVVTLVRRRRQRVAIG